MALITHACSFKSTKEMKAKLEGVPCKVASVKHIMYVVPTTATKTSFYCVFLKRGSDFWGPWQLTHPLKNSLQEEGNKKQQQQQKPKQKNPENGNQSKPSLNHEPQSRVMSWLSQTSGCLKAGGPTTAHWGQSDCGPRRPLPEDKSQFIKLDRLHFGHSMSLQDLLKQLKNWKIQN